MSTSYPTGSVIKKFNITDSVAIGAAYHCGWCMAQGLRFDTTVPDATAALMRANSDILADHLGQEGCAKFLAYLITSHVESIEAHRRR